MNFLFELGTCSLERGLSMGRVMFRVLHKTCSLKHGLSVTLVTDISGLHETFLLERG